MDSDALKRFYQSARLAETLVEREMRHAKLKRLKAPPHILKGDEDLVTRARQELEADMLAIELLPQAIRRVSARHERQRALEALLIGKLKDGIESFELVLSSKTEGLPLAFDDEDDRRRWREFCRMLLRNNHERALKFLYQFLSSAVDELVYTELPPAVPKYRYDEKEIDVPPEGIN